jgi:hypothetical protein
VTAPPSEGPLLVGGYLYSESWAARPYLSGLDAHTLHIVRMDGRYYTVQSEPGRLLSLTPRDGWGTDAVYAEGGPLHRGGERAADEAVRLIAATARAEAAAEALARAAKPKRTADDAWADYVSARDRGDEAAADEAYDECRRLA